MDCERVFLQQIDGSKLIKKDIPLKSEIKIVSKIDTNKGAKP